MGELASSPSDAAGPQRRSVREPGRVRQALRAMAVGFLPRARWPFPDPPVGTWPDVGRLPSRPVLVAALVCAVASASATGGAPAGTGVAPAPATADACGPEWVTGWQTAAQAGPADPAMAGATLRMVVRPQVTGSEVRVRLSNAYGATAMVVGTVSAARSDGAAGLVAGTVAPVTFGGHAGVTIPAGGEAVSDAVPLVAEAGRPLAVSMYLPGAPATVTGHPIALQTSYLSRAGDLALAPDGSGFDTAVRSWLVLTGVDVLAPRPVNAVVMMGDSITDGVGSAVDADERWTDALAERLTESGGRSGMSVLNAGISRNRLLTDDAVLDGDSPLTRFGRDVDALAGAQDVVLHIGTNDAAAGSSAAEIVTGMVRFAERTRAAGKRVFLTTVTPSDAGVHGTPGVTATREAVNAWVLSHGAEHADGVFDFAAAVTDPRHPSRLAPAFDSGDGLHLSAAGYRALADAVDVGQLAGSPCLADPTPARVAVSGG